MLTVVLGGARSGKSGVAEHLAAALPAPVTYVATIEVGGDADLATRVEAHRQRRPPSWDTVEAGRDLPEVLAGIGGTVLVDSLGPWLARFDGGAADGAALCRALVGRTGDSIVVSEEVGMGVHPSSELGRRFRDDLGSLNQQLAAVADEVLLVVAGLTLPLTRPSR